MTAVPTYAVVPSNGRDFLHDCLVSLQGQTDTTVLVVNGGFSVTEPWTEGLKVVYDHDRERNISRWWNLGIDEAQRLAEAAGHPEWNVLIVNDDVVCPPRLSATLGTCMRLMGCDLAYPNQFDGQQLVHRTAGPVNLHHRITGYAFMLRGESGLRLDESFVWWAGDDDLDWRAREQRGAVLVPGCAVEHRAPNGSMIDHPELQAQAGRDMQTFQDKWGLRPW